MTTPDTPDPMRPDRPDTSGAYRIMVTVADSMQAMREQVNSARCAVIHHHRASHDAPVTHRPILAEELWEIIHRRLADVVIWQHQDNHPDTGMPGVTYTVELPAMVSDPAIGAATGAQEWFTTHPHPDPAARAVKRDASFGEMLDAARYIHNRYPECPPVTAVHIESPAGSQVRIRFQVGLSYSPGALTALSTWAERFDAPVVIEYHYGHLSARMHAPGPDGTPVAFEVQEYLPSDWGRSLAVRFEGLDGVTTEGHVTRVPGKLFAQTWRDIVAAHKEAGGIGWPLDDDMKGHRK